MDEFLEMPRNMQLCYIASEELEEQCPQAAISRLCAAYVKQKEDDDG